MIIGGLVAVVPRRRRRGQVAGGRRHAAGHAPSGYPRRGGGAHALSDASLQRPRSPRGSRRSAVQLVRAPSRSPVTARGALATPSPGCFLQGHIVRGRRGATMDFLQPTSWQEALELRAEHPDAVPIAGGTDVMVEHQLRPPPARCAARPRPGGGAAGVERPTDGARPARRRRPLRPDHRRARRAGCPGLAHGLPHGRLPADPQPRHASAATSARPPRPATPTRRCWPPAPSSRWRRCPRHPADPGRRTSTPA